MNFEGELLKDGTDSLLLHFISSEPMYSQQIIKERERRSKGSFLPIFLDTQIGQC
jgi:DNA-binding PadR family transcriptional regulator